jgi:hypothetical protein
LLRATNLLTGFNGLVRTNIPATTPLNTETDSTAVGAAARFYRLELEP